MITFLIVLSIVELGIIWLLGTWLKVSDTVNVELVYKIRDLRSDVECEQVLKDEWYNNLLHIRKANSQLIRIIKKTKSEVKNEQQKNKES